jgi:drug/metabolite transporter (DMT)-like permease
MAIQVSRRGTAATGAFFATVTAVIWGGQFVVGKDALRHVDAFPLTAMRYALAAVLLLSLLLAVEGRGALRLEGRGWRLFGLGSLGFGGFNLLAYTGLAHARPESASLIVALGPLVTAVVLWLRDGIRPALATGVAVVVALVGIALVVSKGDPNALVDGSVGWGDGLVLLGVISFVLYTLGAARHRELSPLRYTALTAGLGWFTIAGASVVGMASGLVQTPTAGDVGAVVPHLLYLAVPGALVAVLTWNAAVVRIGPQNTALIGNLIPVTTFVIEIVRGYRPGGLELAGAVIAVGALAANNLLQRRRAPARETRGAGADYETELEAA